MKEQALASMGEMDNKGFMENFAMIIPKTAIYQLNGVSIFGATKEDFDGFKKWFESQNYQQLQLNGQNLDLWIRYNDMVIDSIGYSLQNLFKQWKENPPSNEPFTVTTHTFKK